MEGIAPPTLSADELVRGLLGKVGGLVEGELQGALLCAVRAVARDCCFRLSDWPQYTRAAAGGEDLTLIENMNLVTGRQYREMAQCASGYVGERPSHACPPSSNAMLS